MTDLPQSAGSPPPAWLVRVTAASAVMALLALTTLLWARWGVVLAMSTDFLRNCF